MTTLAWEDTVPTNERTLLNAHGGTEYEHRRAEVDNVTYFAHWTNGGRRLRNRRTGYEATLFAVGRRGGLKMLELGVYGTIAQAKRICEQHYADGCDLSRAR